jgi:uncharacterized membrane protein YedE/YeeE
MSRLIAAALIGAIFGLGLVISGMTLPAKVIGFLDFAGDWDPALGFVMVGAIGVHMSTRWLVLRRDGPVMGDAFPAGLPTQIDRRLLIGAALFGLGWGLAGYCPGPAIVSVGVGGAKAWLFVGTMILGMALSRARS